MGEGIIKTVIAGKNSNVIGNSDSPLILRGQGIKVQWGNKFIDLIKNGKINVDSEKILKIADSIESVTTDGIYLIEDLIWVVIDKVKTQLSGNSDTTYISFLVELPEITAEQKLLALTNIGFYYDTFEDAQAAGLTSGLIYVQGDNKLYIVKEGTLLEYIFNTNDALSEDLLNKLYIEGHSLMVEGIEYATLNYNTILLHKELILKEGLLSEDATSFLGFRIYIKNGKSYLEIDKVIERDWKGNSLIETTYSELKELINKKELLPKLYYLITDFQNPWEVTWGDEPIFFEDLYTEINGFLHLSGVRNAMQLIVLAKTYTLLELQAFSLTNPNWIIHYDIHYIGPEETGGFRKRTKDDGSIEYLPCKGRITYLKDELGNEGNFNFRQFMFKHKGYWRYCSDLETSQYFGKFSGSNNIFNIDSLEAFVQVFSFIAEYDSNGEVIKYSVKAIDSDVQLSKGHCLYIDGEDSNYGNVFELKDLQKTCNHDIIANNIINNKFIDILGNIICTLSIINNTFKNITGTELNAIEIYSEINENILTDINNTVVIKEATIFNKNHLSNFKYWINNISEFQENSIKKCDGQINNSGKFIKNSIETIEGNISNNEQSTISDNVINLVKGNIRNSREISFNNFEEVEEIHNSGIIKNNIINNILYIQNEISGKILDNKILKTKQLTNSGDILNNNIGEIEILTNELNGKIEDNNINNVIELQNTNIIKGNNINVIEKVSNQGIIENNIIGNFYINNYTLGKVISNNINTIKSELINDNIIENNTINEIEKLSIFADIKNNKIDSIYKVEIYSPMEGNNINTISESSILDNASLSYNLFLNIKKCLFHYELTNNVFNKDIDNCEFGVFKNNIINDIIESSNFLLASIEDCIFYKPVNKFNIGEVNVNKCSFEYISNFTLNTPAYYATFHGFIGGDDVRELTIYEKNLLKDSFRKKDVYPNIKVICVPEIILPGMILMWHGGTTIPNGWALCDGSNGTPDLRNRFIKAADGDGSGTPTGVLGEVNPRGDEDNNEITITVNNLPEHEHPHLLHQHAINLNIETDNATISTSNIEVITGLGTTRVDNSVEDSQIEVYNSKDTGNINISGEHKHNITISNKSTELALSEEVSWQYKDKPDSINIEPKHYKLIFIMKIDQDPSIFNNKYI